MKFNYRQELKKFNEWWAKERQILEEENAAEETIQDIYITTPFLSLKQTETIICIKKNT